MAQRATETDIKTLPKPAKGNKVFFIDKGTPGFGIRVTSADWRAYVLDYRTLEGRQRRITIGDAGRWDEGVWRPGSWKLAAARDEARRYRREVDAGGDPMADRHEAREAPTVDELADRFVAEHLSKRRPSTKRDYESLLKRYIRPALGRTMVAKVTHSDIEKLHRDVESTAPYQANRAAAVLSKMMTLAVKWGMRVDNPVRGLERAPEQKRERFLSPAEVGRLADALAVHPERVSADAIRLLLLSGARRAEVLSATWSQFDLEAGVWTKPSSQTKQKKEHRIPLSAPAMALLVAIRERADADCPFVFPGAVVKGEDGRYAYRHIVEVKKTWAAVCKAAGLARNVPLVTSSGEPVRGDDGKPKLVWENTVRLHDLRHSYASILASAGLSLQIVGRLLGHTQPATTHRYAHLYDDVLRAATERVGAVVTSASRPSAEVLPVRKAGA